MTILDAMQQKTTIQFSNAKVNPALVSAGFQFEVPAGTDVIQAKAQ
jgi:outer membrane lipoprotein-sorting protein